MKRFCYLIVFVGVLFACSREVDTTEHLYLCNALEESVTLTLFKGEEVVEYEIKPNDTIYLTTIHSGYVVGGGVNVHFPPATDRALYLGSFDSATVAYNSLFYTFTTSEILYYDSTNISVLPLGYAYPIHSYHRIGDYSYYTYDEEYFEILDRAIEELPLSY
jgi:hypothetical protein